MKKQTAVKERPNQEKQTTVHGLQTTGCRGTEAEKKSTDHSPQSAGKAEDGRLKTADSSPSLGEALRSYRIAHKLTQKELAEKLDVSIGTVINIESGASQPKRKSIRDSICNLLEITSTDVDIPAFVERLKAFRSTHKLTLNQFSHLVDCGYSTIANIECGYYRPSEKLIAKINEVMGNYRSIESSQPVHVDTCGECSHFLRHSMICDIDRKATDFATSACPGFKSAKTQSEESARQGKSEDRRNGQPMAINDQTEEKAIQNADCKGQNAKEETRKSPELKLRYINRRNRILSETLLHAIDCLAPSQITSELAETANRLALKTFIQIRQNLFLGEKILGENPHLAGSGLENDLRKESSMLRYQATRALNCKSICLGLRNVASQQLGEFMAKELSEIMHLPTIENDSLMKFLDDGDESFREHVIEK